MSEYRALLGELDAWFARGVRDAGPDVVLCRRGCTACCHGPFDISPADAQLVVAAVAALDSATRNAVIQRARSQVDRYPLHAAEWRAPWDVDAIPETHFDALCDALEREPCPALGADGACTIYHDRPATCRLLGLAMITPAGGQLENACPILHTSAAFAALAPTAFDLESFEDRADRCDAAAAARGAIRTTIAGAIVTMAGDS